MAKEEITPSEWQIKAYFNEKMNSLYTHPSQRGMWTAAA